jgi:hypothetical protein
MVLDRMRVDAAVKAGAELRVGFTVQEVTVGRERPTGVRGHGQSGGAVPETARVVVGSGSQKDPITGYGMTDVRVHLSARRDAGANPDDTSRFMGCWMERFPRRGSSIHRTCSGFSPLPAPRQ